MLFVPESRGAMCNPKAHNKAGWHEDFLPLTPREREADIYADGYREGFKNGRDSEARIVAIREASQGRDVIYF